MAPGRRHNIGILAAECDGRPFIAIASPVVVSEQLTLGISVFPVDLRAAVSGSYIIEALVLTAKYDGEPRLGARYSLGSLLITGELQHVSDYPPYPWEPHLAVKYNGDKLALSMGLYRYYGCWRYTGDAGLDIGRFNIGVSLEQDLQVPLPYPGCRVAVRIRS